jgi:NAD(P)-dependent dehydrogenase (short-subunit alcohol dehydrogenase family)
VGALEGKVAVVTGGGSGIGLATATRLAEAGASVALVDLDGAAAQRVADDLDGMALQADVGRSSAWSGIVDVVTARFGGIDLAHLNAGVMTGEADITEVTDDSYRRAVGVNIDGVFFGVRALVPAMTARCGGAIVATASLAGLIGFSPDPVYCMTKHAVVGLVRSLSPQLAEHHITINCV